jgi:predicted dienelactone hydrolase
MATFLCTHLASHGYVVAAPDHSEVFAPELARRPSETAEEKAARLEALIASRVPDVRFLLDHLLGGDAWDSAARLEATRVGIVGHSFGGWTALAAPDLEPRLRAVVALAPGGASHRKPGMIPATLRFAWGRDVPTLYLVAEDDTSLPLAGMYELFDRTPAAKRMMILRRADHMHFLDEVEVMHEAVRSMPFSGELAWLPREMRPVAELCPGEDAHVFARGLTLCHLDAVLKEREGARRFLTGDIERELSARGIETVEVKRPGVARHSAREP